MGNDKRVVVIGATGNIGTRVVEALGPDPQVGSLVGVARWPTALSCAKTEFVQADVERDDLVPLVRDADAVVHLAWLFQPTHRPERTWQANVLGSLRVLAGRRGLAGRGGLANPRLARCRLTRGPVRGNLASRQSSAIYAEAGTSRSTVQDSEPTPTTRATSPT